MKQSTRLISERRVRAAIFEAYDEHNPDNKPREISQSVIDKLDEAIRTAILTLVVTEPVSQGRLSSDGIFYIEYSS